jgi:hypothetical protein
MSQEDLRNQSRESLAREVLTNEGLCTCLSDGIELLILRIYSDSNRSNEGTGNTFTATTSIELLRILKEGLAKRSIPNLKKHSDYARSEGRTRRNGEVIYRDKPPTGDISSVQLRLAVSSKGRVPIEEAAYTKGARGAADIIAMEREEELEVSLLIDEIKQDKVDFRKTEIARSLGISVVFNPVNGSVNDAMGIFGVGRTQFPDSLLVDSDDNQITDAETLRLRENLNQFLCDGEVIDKLQAIAF